MILYYVETERNGVAEAFNNQTSYLIVNEVNRLWHLVFPQEVRNKSTQFLEEDFIKLNNDFTVEKMYVNGECYLLNQYNK